MPPASQTVEFEGYFAEGVLGIFKIIRGFADLRDLAAISVPYELSDGAESGQVIGHHDTTFHLADTQPFIWTENFLSNRRHD